MFRQPGCLDSLFSVTVCVLQRAGIWGPSVGRILALRRADSGTGNGSLRGCGAHYGRHLQKEGSSRDSGVLLGRSVAPGGARAGVHQGKDAGRVVAHGGEGLGHPI